MVLLRPLNERLEEEKKMSLSVFDIIGPNMVGPSSSHTAGALKIASLARRLIGGDLIKVKFTLYGSFAKTYKGHGTDKALLGGVLGFDTENPKIRESYLIASERQLSYEFETVEGEAGLHPNTVDIHMTNERNEVTLVRGESIGGGNILIRKINDIDISLTGKYNTILIKQKDVPGVVATITQALSEHKINIAYMTVYRENKGDYAFTVIETDQSFADMPLGSIEGKHGIESIIFIEI